eukprot:222611-Prorocentrum_minimum.AAC.1
MAPPGGPGRGNVAEERGRGRVGRQKEVARRGGEGGRKGSEGVGRCRKMGRKEGRKGGRNLAKGVAKGVVRDRTTARGGEPEATEERHWLCCDAHRQGTSPLRAARTRQSHAPPRSTRTRPAILPAPGPHCPARACAA